MKQTGLIKNQLLAIIVLMIISVLFGLGIILYIENQSQQSDFNNYNALSSESSSSMKIQLEILRNCKNKYEALAEESNTDPYSLEGTECVSRNNPFSFGNIYYCDYKDPLDETGILTKFSKKAWIDDCIDWQRKELNR